MSDFLLALGLVIVALLLGPFVGIIVDRAVERVSFKLGHRCVHCKTDLGIESVIPILHWRTMCGQCGKPKGLRYLVTDIALAVAFLSLGLNFGTNQVLAPYLLLSIALVALAVIDFETHLLPNVIVWPSIWFSLAMLGWYSYFILNVNTFVQALVGAAVFCGVLLIAFVVYPKGMGFGDVKLAFLLGLYIGWQYNSSIIAVRLALYALVISMLGGAILGLVFNALTGKDRKEEVPFGPFLILGSLLVIIFSETLI